MRWFRFFTPHFYRLAIPAILALFVLYMVQS